MSNKRKVLQGSAANVVRMLLSMLVSLVLPPFLVHRLTAAEYSAWVLILQMSSYVYLLDLGLRLRSASSLPSTTRRRPRCPAIISSAPRSPFSAEPR